MRFLDPRTDFAFKKIFGSTQSKGILLEFLNAILYNGEPTIVDLDILDPYQAPQVQGMKDTYVDVKAKLDNEKTVLIEMQVLYPLDFNKRVLYNAAKAYSLQLQRGQGYTRLRPVIALTVIDFILFPERSKVISRYQLREEEDGLLYGDDIELIFIELPKFKKSLEELESLADRWIFFLQQTADLEDVPGVLGESVALGQAFQIAEAGNLSPQEFELLEGRELVLEDNRNIMLKAALDGREEGLQQGLQQGVEQSKREIARSLLDLLPPEVISERTGLSLAEIAALSQPE